MNENNKKIIWKIIQEQGDSLVGKLSPHPMHPKGRNPYAHICGIIKNRFGVSYKDIEDEKFDELKKFIENINN